MLLTKTAKTLFIAFLIVYFLFLVISRTPAAWAVWGVNKAIPSLWLGGIEGTLWSGKASSAQVDLGPATLPLGKVRWQLKPLSLLSLSPCIEFSTELPKQTVNGEICQSASGTSVIKNLDLYAPITSIEELLNVEASGMVSMQVASAEFDSQSKVINMDARFSWENARAYIAETWLTLGSFAATAEEDANGGIKAKLFDLSGPYTTDLDANWQAASGWLFKGTIAPKESAPSMVVQGLEILGEEQDEGVYLVQWP